jgi:hypothetical protein
MKTAGYEMVSNKRKRMNSGTFIETEIRTGMNNIL